MKPINIALLSLMTSLMAGCYQQKAVDQVIVVKKTRQLYLVRNDKVVDKFPIALGRNPVGPKNQVNDGKTPEGEYLISFHNTRSKFTESLLISYPNQQDKSQAQSRGVDPGNAIAIHGYPARGTERVPLVGDWTDGCIAVSNPAIKKIARLVDNGTPITILP